MSQGAYSPSPPSGRWQAFPLIPPQQLLLGQNSSHNTDNSVCPFCLPAAPARVGGENPFCSPELYTGPTQHRVGILCLFNERMDGWIHCG